MTFKLIINMIEPGMYQLVLRLNEKNEHMFLYADTEANCKTAATAMFALPAGYAWTTDNGGGCMTGSFSVSTAGLANVTLVV